jgi:hypothetical protein
VLHRASDLGGLHNEELHTSQIIIRMMKLRKARLARRVTRMDEEFMQEFGGKI